jgi:hypothetical protein
MTSMVTRTGRIGVLAATVSFSQKIVSCTPARAHLFQFSLYSLLIPWVTDEIAINNQR